MNKKEKNCLNCRIHWDRETCCEICRWEDNDNPSLFYRITRSPEVLAEKLVYWDMSYYDDSENPRCKWASTIIDDVYFDDLDEAIAATVAKLKEVADAEN